MRSLPALGIALLLALAPASAHAIGSNTFYLGAGVFLQNSLKTTTTATASKSLIGTPYLPELSLSARLGGASYFYPTLGYTILAKTGADGVKKRIMTLTVPYAFPIGAGTDLKLGVGMLMYTVGGDGEARTMNSGASTAVFYQPGTSQSSRVLFLMTGFGFSLADEIRFDLDLALTGALTSRRALNVAARLAIGVF